VDCRTKYPCKLSSCDNDFHYSADHHGSNACGSAGSKTGGKGGCNVLGTADDKHPGGKSWIQHWRDKTGKSNPDCSVKGCGNVGSHGAHVTKERTRPEVVHCTQVSIAQPAFLGQVFYVQARCRVCPRCGVRRRYRRSCVCLIYMIPTDVNKKVPNKITHVCC
jgi:hypothetical protein